MQLSELSDENLVSLKCDDKSQILSILYTRYKNYSYAIIYSKLTKYNCVHSLYEEKDSIIFESLYEAIESFCKDKGLFRPYFVGILSNKTITRIREFLKDPVSNSYSIDQQIGTSDILFSDSQAFASDLPTPDESYYLEEDNNIITSPIKGLNKRKQLKILKLKKLGYTTTEIARACNCSTKTIRIIFYKIRDNYIELSRNTIIEKVSSVSKKKTI